MNSVAILMGLCFLLFFGVIAIGVYKGDPEREACAAKGGDFIKTTEPPHRICVERMKRL